MNGYTEWQSQPEITQVNALPPRASFTPFGTVGGALSFDKLSSDRMICLNGQWKFNWAKNFADAPADFFEEDYDCSSWDDIDVPSSWQLKGFDHPIYCNIQYPWEGNERIHQPNAPVEFNPVGSYVKRINIPDDFSKGRMVICFEGVESAYYLFVNGQRAGYSEGTFRHREFDVTSYVHEGENVFAVQVFRWCTGSWLEDQDFFRLSGIFRNVYLYTTHPAYIADFKVEAKPEFASGTGKISVDLTLANGDETELDMVVLDGNGDTVGRDSCSPDGNSAKLEATIAEAKLWSAENPELYTILFTLSDNRGSLLEATAAKTGFRTVEQRQNVIFLNNKPLKLLGVNRHELTFDGGRVVSRETMISDIELLKSHNCNAVRTSHYPNCEEWYDLCDEYGLYIIDENDLESHGARDPFLNSDPLIPGDEKNWENSCMDRITSLYERDKNHPCVVIWSLGNECDPGENFQKMHDYLHSVDSRPVHYESIWNYFESGKDVTDIYSMMYAKPWDMAEHMKQHPEKPHMLCEYAHAMGNSFGGNEKYIELLKEPGFLGLFVWDFVDQALIARKKDGTEFFGYGGDFGDNPNDGNFSGDGLLLADRTPTSKLIEMKRLYQQVEFVCLDIKSGKIKIKNNFLFTNLSAFNLHWQRISVNRIIESGDEHIELAPGDERTITLPFARNCSSEWYLQLTLELCDNASWAKVGHAVAQAQFVANEFELERTSIEKSKADYDVEYGTVYIDAGDLSIAFSRRSNTLYSIKKNGVELLASPIKPEFWRAETDNDRGNHMAVRCGTWRFAARHTTFRLDSVEKGENSVTLRTSFVVPTHPAETRGSIIYLIGSKGIDVTMELTLPKGVPEVPHIGLSFALAQPYASMEYLGAGPHDNYIDRRASADIGLYSVPIDKLFVPYLKPQESGNRTRVRRAALKGAHPLAIEAETEFELNVCKWSIDELEAAAHPCELPESKRLFVNVSARQMGVGGYDSWGARTLPEHEIHAGESFYLRFRLLV